MYLLIKIKNYPSYPPPTIVMISILSLLLITILFQSFLLQIKLLYSKTNKHLL